VTRYEQPLTTAEIRFHGALAAAIRLTRPSFSFSQLGRAFDHVFPQHDCKFAQNRDFYLEFDPCESTFFSACLSLHVIEWESVGDRAWITYSSDAARKSLHDFCAGEWSEYGGVWSPDAFTQIAEELFRA
jgi:hypothetical protein